VKGKTLSEDSWDNFPVVNGGTILLMGTKEEDIETVPIEKPKFVEDLNESELACAVSFFLTN